VLAEPGGQKYFSSHQSDSNDLPAHVCREQIDAIEIGIIPHFLQAKKKPSWTEKSQIRGSEGGILTKLRPLCRINPPGNVRRLTKDTSGWRRTSLFGDSTHLINLAMS
jgi:hypothetical protein